MAYTTISNEADLLRYIKDDLGDISNCTVELSAAQWLDCINDAIKVFLEEAYEGSNQYYEELDLVEGTQVYTLDAPVLEVLKVISSNLDGSNRVAMQEFYTNTFDYSGIMSSQNILNFAMTQSYLNSLDDIIFADNMFTYNSSTKKLTILTTVTETKTVLLHSIRNLDPTVEVDFNTIYNHTWIKARSCANAWHKWGKALIKYGGELTGGKTINSEAILEEGKEQIEKTDESLRNKYVDSFSIVIS